MWVKVADKTLLETWWSDRERETFCSGISGRIRHKCGAAARSFTTRKEEPSEHRAQVVIRNDPLNLYLGLVPVGSSFLSFIWQRVHFQIHSTALFPKSSFSQPYQSSGYSLSSLLFTYYLKKCPVCSTCSLSSLIYFTYFFYKPRPYYIYLYYIEIVLWNIKNTILVTFSTLQYM